jgi:hypothetical protein
MRARLFALLLAAPLALTGCDAAGTLLVPVTSGGNSGIVTGGTSGSLAITRTSADPSNTTVAKGETLKLTVEANQQGATFSWTATGGSLSPAGSTASWTAPSTTGTYTVNVTARYNGAEAPASFRFNVQ